jgi:pyridoxal phosphate enzyme (YggS family)
MASENAGLGERYSMVSERIARACGRAGRPADAVTLIAVTKTHPVATLQALIDLGVRNLGENRVAEIVEKVPLLRGSFTMHCIGHLQTNKVARVVPHVGMVQSIDRERVIESLEKHLPEGAHLPVLIEVNTSGEASKEGCAPGTGRQLVERCLAGGRLTPEGFMTVGPLGGNERAVRASFILLRREAESVRDLIVVPQLSMGMSSDFEWAIEEGATMVRIGTLLTGGRG